MKKIVSSILIVITFGQIFAPFSFSINKEKNTPITPMIAEAALDCEIIDVIIPPSPTKRNSDTREDKRPEQISFTVKTANCLNKTNVTLSVNIQEKDFIGNEKLLEGHQKGPFTNNDLKFSYIPGETSCEEGSCEIYYSIRLVEDGKEIDNYTNSDTGFYCTSKNKDGNDFCADGLTDDGNGNKPIKKWEWAEESASPTAEFWFFKVKYANGTSFVYSPYNTEPLCEAKRNLINKSAGEGTEVGPCEFKKNEQIVSSIVYYYEILNTNKVIGESETFGTTDECNNDRKAFEDGQEDQNITTSECKTKEVNQVIGGIDHGGVETSGLPVCTFLPMRLGGCIAQGIYFLFFKTSSYLFAQIGIILDFSIMYSIDNDSYESTFVVEGWGIVRDFCNMFFIFILLYIAFGTILGLHSVKTKETIINVILIGLLINFSLFATQVIVDASNILTRVFYNENTISTGTLEGKSIKSQLGDFGEIQLSSAIVNKVDPQKLILEATTVNDIQIRGTASNEDQDSVQTSKGKITVGTFILVTLLATAINVIGIIVFLSSALIFISRVLGLWLAMILAPLAFFSYIVPSMKSFKMIGWSHWWPETLKLAFLAPVFMFFIYLIIKFLDKGLGLVDAATRSGAAKSGMGLVLSIVVPFIFIMVLLMKAKDIAKDMSGEMGQQITSGLSKAGGFALGAATGGAAMLGRASVGRIANKMNNSNWLNNAAAGKNGAVAQTFGKFGKKMASFGAKSSFDVRQNSVANAFSKETGLDLNKGTNVLGLDTKKGLGGYAAVQERKVEKENKFGESLGYDHHKHEDIQDAVGAAEGSLAAYKSDTKVDHNTTEYKAEVARRENEINTLKKDLEREKTGRAKEYALSVKKKSGRIYNHVERDDNGNIKKFGHAEKDANQAAKQIAKEFIKGFAKGIAPGAIAGSVVPVVGTIVGAIGGGLVGALKSTMIDYSGTTNRKVGDEHHGDKNEIKDKYKPSSPEAHKSDSHGGGHDSKDAHDSHGDAEHGGGGHH